MKIEEEKLKTMVAIRKPIVDVSWLPEQTLPQIEIDAPLVFINTELTTLKPKDSHYDILFGLNQKSPTWAAFQAPEGYYNQVRKCYHITLIPGLTIDQINTGIELLETISEQSPELEALVNLYSTLDELTTLMHYLDGKRRQYAK